MTNSNAAPSGAPAGAAADAPAVPLRDPGMYPWLIAFAGMLSLFVSNGMTATGITIFDPALLNEFGWGRGDFKFRDTLNLVVAGLVAPVAGILIDRVNPKYLMMTGCALLTMGYLGYSMIANGGPVPLIEAIAVVTIAGLATFLYLGLRQLLHWSVMVSGAVAGLVALGGGLAYWQAWSGIALKQVYMIHLLFALVLSTAGSMVIIFLVSSWFVRHRGLAIGIALVGTSMGSAILPLFNPDLIAAYGWRQSYVINAAMPVLMFLVVLFLIKGTPPHAGTTARPEQRDRRPQAARPDLPRGDPHQDVLDDRGVRVPDVFLDLQLRAACRAAREQGFRHAAEGSRLPDVRVQCGGDDLEAREWFSRRHLRPSQGVHRLLRRHAARRDCARHDEPRTAVPGRHRHRDGLGRPLHALQHARGQQLRPAARSDASTAP
jgi:MFS family permease